MRIIKNRKFHALTFQDEQVVSSRIKGSCNFEDKHFQGFQTSPRNL